MTPDQYCKRKTVKSGSSFYYSFMFLAPSQRLAMYALYAFCREVDDIADNYSELSVAEQKLSWWQTEIDRLFNKSPQHPITQALAPHIDQYKLPKQWFEDILQGMWIDLRGPNFHKYSELEQYCYYVAGAVGLLSCKIFGQSHDDTLKFAVNMGKALQIANIIRDIGEDARRGRIYISHDSLTKFTVTPKQILEQSCSQEKLAPLLDNYANKSRSYFNSAIQLLPDVDRANQRSGLIMGNIYMDLLNEITKSNYEVLNQKIKLTPIRKIIIAFRTLRQEKKLLRSKQLA